jgi:hypothetical protein
MQLSYLLDFIIIKLNLLTIDCFLLTYFEFAGCFQLIAKFGRLEIFIHSNKDSQMLFAQKFMIYLQNLFSKCS